MVLQIAKAVLMTYYSVYVVLGGQDAVSMLLQYNTKFSLV